LTTWLDSCIGWRSSSIRIAWYHLGIPESSVATR
jgi:hypothetical protein